jgi:ribonuclease HI
MNHYLLHMEITDFIQNYYVIEIMLNKEKTVIHFSPKTKELEFPRNDSFTDFLKTKEFQLRKILHNKQSQTFFKGFKLDFVLQDIILDSRLYDKTKVTILDNTDNKYIIRKADHKSTDIIEAYTDGSYLSENKSGAFAVLIKSVSGKNELKSFKTSKKGSNLIELIAVVKSLELLKDENKLCIYTDSQYVIKGITEWMPVWMLNNWYTANGTKAKNIVEWKKVYRLVKNKYIEFVWIKGHTNQPENTLCDKTAKEKAKKK